MNIVFIIPLEFNYKALAAEFNTRLDKDHAGDYHFCFNFRSKKSPLADYSEVFIDLSGLFIFEFAVFTVIHSSKDTNSQIEGITEESLSGRKENTNLP